MDKQIEQAQPEKGKTGAAAEGQLAEQLDIDNVAATSRRSEHKKEREEMGNKKPQPPANGNS